jgi:hypothetical protein
VPASLPAHPRRAAPDREDSSNDSQSFIVLLLAFGEEGLPSEHTVLGKEKAKWEEARCKTVSPSVPA